MNVLNSFNRLLFFSNNYPISRIEKASLDGQNRGVIVHKGLSRVLSLAVDTVNDKLYWADYGRYTLEGSDYDGSNRRVIRHINFVSVTGIAYHKVTNKMLISHKFVLSGMIFQTVWDLLFMRYHSPKTQTDYAFVVAVEGFINIYVNWCIFKVSVSI